MTRYFGLREFLVLSVMVWTYVLLLGAPLGNLLLFWALPSILSSLQLFYFGTYLPHRHEEAEFADEHRARSNDFRLLCLAADLLPLRLSPRASPEPGHALVGAAGQAPRTQPSRLRLARIAFLCPPFAAHLASFRALGEALGGAGTSRSSC
jgi:hypothetical protein